MLTQSPLKLCWMSKLHKNEYLLEIYISISVHPNIYSQFIFSVTQFDHFFINKIVLQRPKKDGGMGLPDFHHFYWAANIRCMAFWTHPHLWSMGPDWTLLELSSCKYVSLLALLGSPFDGPSLKPLDNLVVSHIFKM